MKHIDRNMLARILAELDLDDLLETHEAIGELAEEMAVAEDSHPLKVATQRVLNSTTLLIRANTPPPDEWSRGEIAAYSLLTGLIIGLITPVTLPPDTGAKCERCMEHESVDGGSLCPACLAFMGVEP